MLRSRGQRITRDRHLRYGNGAHHPGHSLRLEAGHQGSGKSDRNESEVGHVDEVVFRSDESHGQVRPDHEESCADAGPNGQAIGEGVGHARYQHISRSGAEYEDAHDEEITEGPVDHRGELHGNEWDGEDAGGEKDDVFHKVRCLSLVVVVDVGAVGADRIRPFIFEERTLICKVSWQKKGSGSELGPQKGSAARQDQKER